MDKAVISHSEVESFSLCERRHYYAFGERLARKRHSAALETGINGHYLMLEVFFKSLQRTGSWDHAMAELQMAIIQSVAKTDDPKVIQDLARIVTGWLEHFREKIETWEILEVESKKQLDFGDFVFAFTCDLVIRERGNRTIIDFKFVYDFYSDDLLALLPQIPRYVGAERALGLGTRYGKYAFVRYRHLKSPSNDDLYAITQIDLPLARIQNAFKDVKLSLQRIQQLRALPLEEWEQSVTRVSSSVVCKRCQFKDLCSAELSGSDGVVIRATEYELSTYGYTEANE